MYVEDTYQKHPDERQSISNVYPTMFVNMENKKKYQCFLVSKHLTWSHVFSASNLKVKSLIKPSR